MFIRTICPVQWADSLCLPLLIHPVSAGFPSPADDFLQSNLNLQDALIPHPVSTFLMRVQGDSMTGCGIYSGDLVIVDRSIDPVDGAVVIAVLEGKFTVKRFRKTGSQIMLAPEHPDYPPIVVTLEMDFYVWGVVTFNVHGHAGQ